MKSLLHKSAAKSEIFPALVETTSLSSFFLCTIVCVCLLIYLQVTLDLTFQQAVSGCSKPITVSVVDDCPTCDGEKVEPGTRKQRCFHCNGTGRVSSDPHLIPYHLRNYISYFNKICRVRCANTRIHKSEGLVHIRATMAKMQHFC